MTTRREAPRDDLGHPVPLAGPPRRVVSLVPSLTETIASVAPRTLVGATTYCVEPAGLDVARVGGSKYPVVAEIRRLAPDLVLANGEESRPQDVAELRDAGVAVWVTAAPATVLEALDSLRRLLAEAFRLPPPDWLTEAERRWRIVPPIRARVVVPVWRRPWIVLGRDTFAGDVLRGLGLDNVGAILADAALRAAAEAGDAPTGTTNSGWLAAQGRYPRPSLVELRELFAEGAADLLVLPDEPYAFHAQDGPEAFPDVPFALVSGRHLTWYGPSLTTAAEVLGTALDQALAAREGR